MMTTRTEAETGALEYEGTWEEILKHMGELAGRRVRVTVPAQGQPELTDQQREMLAAADELQYGDFPAEERAALEEMGDFIESHRFTLRPPEYFDNLPEEPAA